METKKIISWNNGFTQVSTEVDKRLIEEILSLNETEGYIAIKYFGVIYYVGLVREIIKLNNKLLVKTTEFQDYYRVEHYPINYEIPVEWTNGQGRLLNSISLIETILNNAPPEGEYLYCGCERNFCECEVTKNGSI